MLKIFRFVLLISWLVLSHCQSPKEPTALPALHVGIVDLHYSSNWTIHKIGGLYTFLITGLITEPLLRQSPDGTLEPGLFESWTLSSNGKVLTARVSNKFKFHDGRKIEVEDVIFSLNKAFGRNKSNVSSRHLIGRLCPQASCKITKLQNRMISIDFGEFSNTIIPSLTLSELSVFPKSYYKPADKKGVLHNLSGPYKVIKFEENLMHLKAVEDHPLIQPNSPRDIFLHQVETPQAANLFLQKHEHSIVYSASRKRATQIKINNKIKQKALPPIISEVFLLNRLNKKLSARADRKRIASKLRRVLDNMAIRNPNLEVTSQYFPPHSKASLNKDAIDFYSSYEKSINDRIEIVTYDEFGFDDLFKDLKQISNQQKLSLKLTELGKKAFFEAKNDGIPDKTLHEIFYYFTGVGSPAPIFELIYMIEHTGAGRLKPPQIELLLNKALTEPNRQTYSNLIKQLHQRLLGEYLIIPLRHSAPAFHIKGALCHRKMFTQVRSISGTGSSNEKYRHTALSRICDIYYLPCKQYQRLGLLRVYD